jgi:Protein of unknown function (DUF2752)
MKTARCPWIALSLVTSIPLLWVAAKLMDGRWLQAPACPFKTLTTFPCAACGLTRCVMALSHGQWREALHWHPVAVLLIALSPLLGIWDLRRAWRGEAYPGLPDSLAWRMGAAGLFLGTWALQVARGI